MELFRAHELMALVIGNEDYDWDAFEHSAKYKGGYTSGDPTVLARHSRNQSRQFRTLQHFIPFHFFDVDTLVLGSFSRAAARR